MKNLLSVILILIAFNSYSQKEKTINVATIDGKYYVTATITYNENIPKDTVYMVVGRDSRYKNIIELISIVYTNDLKDVYDFFNYAIKFCNTEESGTSDTFIKDSDYNIETKVCARTVGGMKFLTIYDTGDNSDGYLFTTSADMKNLLAKLDTWRTVNKVSINK